MAEDNESPIKPTEQTEEDITEEEEDSMIADKEGLVIRKLSETVTDFIENIGEDNITFLENPDEDMPIFVGLYGSS